MWLKVHFNLDFYIAFDLKRVMYAKIYIFESNEIVYQFFFTYLLILAFWSGQWSLTIVWNATLVYSAWKIYLNMLALIPNHLSMTLRVIFLFRKNLTVGWEDTVVH